MVLSATRYFGASFGTAEYLLEERDLTDDEEETVRDFHALLGDVQEDVWGVESPQLDDATGE